MTYNYSMKQRQRDIFELHRCREECTDCKNTVSLFPSQDGLCDLHYNKLKQIINKPFDYKLDEHNKKLFAEHFKDMSFGILLTDSRGHPGIIIVEEAKQKVVLCTTQEFLHITMPGTFCNIVINSYKKWESKATFDRWDSTTLFDDEQWTSFYEALKTESPTEIFNWAMSMKNNERLVFKTVEELEQKFGDIDGK